MAQGMTVAITGASGYIGSKLVHALDADDRVGRILGFDVRPPVKRPSKLVFDELDVRSGSLEQRLSGVDALVHLSFVMDPIHDETLMRDINVNGSQNVFASAAAAGVGKIVYTSSMVAYGAHPDNPVPLREDDRLRANLDFSYAAHKLEVEYLLQELRASSPDLTTTIFRPAIVFGANVDNAWSHMLELPLLMGIRGYEPPLQFVHEDDVARALHFAAVEAELDGPYNLAAPGWLPSEEIVEIVGRRRFDVSEQVAFGVSERMWSLGLAEAPAGMLHYVMHPWVGAVDKLTAAGFEARRSNAEVLTEAVEAGRGFVRLGRRRVRRAHLAQGAAAGLGLAAAVAVARSRD